MEGVKGGGMVMVMHSAVSLFCYFFWKDFDACGSDDDDEVLLGGF